MKKKTYEQAQYDLAYSLLREAYSLPKDSSERQGVWDYMDLEIEDSYYYAASRSFMAKRKRGKTGVYFWMDKYELIRWYQENLPLARKIKSHVEVWFIERMRASE